jgi:homoserine O-succinyltransferase
MTLLFDKHRTIVSPTLAPTQWRDADQLDSPRDAGATLTIGLVNNMPDTALQATERQFTRLLEAAAGDHLIHLHCFSLPSVTRSQPAKGRVDQQYTDIAELGRLHIDGLIVTGAEPNAATLPEEPFWRELTGIVDWAKTNTRSTIWSCLAAHAAVLHLDGIERQRLTTKCSGVYDCAKVTDHWLTRDIASPVRVAHSRLNTLRHDDLVARGYQVLTESVAAAGISARHHPIPVRRAGYLSGLPDRLFRRRDRTQAYQLPETRQRGTQDAAERPTSRPHASSG